VQEARERLLAQERLVRIFEDTVRPVLEENATLTDAALQLGDVNVLQFVTAQDRVLRGRREFVDARLEYWKAAFDLERALGARLADVEGKED
jgi:outer membrane protein TolC